MTPAMLDEVRGYLQVAEWMHGDSATTKRGRQKTVVAFADRLFGWKLCAKTKTLPRWPDSRFCGEQTVVVYTAHILLEEVAVVHKDLLALMKRREAGEDLSTRNSRPTLPALAFVALAVAFIRERRGLKVDETERSQLRRVARGGHGLGVRAAKELLSVFQGEGRVAAEQHRLRGVSEVAPWEPVDGTSGGGGPVSEALGRAAAGHGERLWAESAEAFLRPFMAACHVESLQAPVEAGPSGPCRRSGDANTEFDEFESVVAAECLAALKG